MELVLGPHQGRLTWEQIYEGWESDEYQYYWRDLTLETVSKRAWPHAERQT